MVSTFVMAVALVANSSATYDCSVTPPRNLYEANGHFEASRMGFPQFTDADWRFILSLASNDDGISAVIDWPRNPIQIAGRFAGLPTSEGSIVFPAYSRGPCAFTESMCMSLVHLVEQASGPAKLVISPAAIATVGEAHTREPLRVLIEGTCTRRGTRS
jgi:hypothetical protein